MKVPSIPLTAMARRRGLAFFAGIFASIFVAGLVAAQPAPSQGSRPDKPPPALDSRDFHGTWYISGAPRAFATDPVPLQPWNQAFNDKALAAQANLEEWHDNSALCHPMGAIDMFWPPYSIRIYEAQDKIYFLSEMNHERRVVYMNAEHPADLKPSFFGHSIGRWEGNTLVVDTIGFNDQTNALTFPSSRQQGARQDIRHTDQMHLVERWSLVDIERGRALKNEVTVEDPGAFTAPWNVTFHFDWRPDLRIVDEECNENNFVTIEQIQATEARGEEIPAIGWQTLKASAAR